MEQRPAQPQPALYFTIKKSPVKALIEASLKPFAEQISDKEIDLQLNYDSKLPEVNIDFEKTVWVLINLIGNALRYSNKWGKIVISAEESAEENKGENQPENLPQNQKSNFIKITVADHGRGIEEHILRRLFKPFTLSDEGGQGLGIGLFISEEVIKAQGGAIAAHSQVGQGSQFSLYLPV